MNFENPISHGARVLVVDDSAFMRTALSGIIASEPGLQVVGTACSGSEALRKIPSLDPDLVTLDLQMPGLDGFEILRRIMHQFPRPVIVVSATGDQDVATARSLGAFDCVSKHLSPESLEIVHIREELIRKIRAAAQLRKAHHARKPPASSYPMPESLPPSAAIVAIGASTGGPNALQQILSVLPRDLSVPILIVQHSPAGFTGAFADRLNGLCSITVREAVHGEPVRAGSAYIAPAGIHLKLQRTTGSHILIRLDSHPSECPHVPSIDVMMKSAADVFENRAVGIILTGMGRDGVEGMKAIRDAGGLTIGQDQSTCAVKSMPRACAELRLLTRVLPLSRIASEIIEASRLFKSA